MAKPIQKAKLFGPLQALLWAGLGTLLGAYINHSFIEKREVVEQRLEAYRAFAEGQARLSRSRDEKDFTRAEELKAEANEKIDFALYQIVYLGSRTTIESLATYIDADAKANSGPLKKCAPADLSKLDAAIYGSMRADLRQAFRRTVCPYHAAILLYKCRLTGPFCAEGNRDCCDACSGVSRPGGESHCSDTDFGFRPKTGP
jgi:hypothetical protein